MRPLFICTLAALLALTSASASLSQQSAPHVQPPPQPPKPPPQPLAAGYPAPPASADTHYSVSGAMASELIRAVPPIYPINAENNHITGVVVLEALIAKDGRVAKVEAISGPAQLRQAAVNAVQQWRYKPAVKDGVPTEFTTRINLNFSVSGH